FAHIAGEEVVEVAAQPFRCGQLIPDLCVLAVLGLPERVADTLALAVPLVHELNEDVVLIHHDPAVQGEATHTHRARRVHGSCRSVALEVGRKLKTGAPRQARAHVCDEVRATLGLECRESIGSEVARSRRFRVSCKAVTTAGGPKDYDERDQEGNGKEEAAHGLPVIDAPTLAISPNGGEDRPLPRLALWIDVALKAALVGLLLFAL